MRDATANQDAGLLALRALVWTLDEPGRAERLLAVTGLTPDRLRAGAGDAATQAAVLDFLAAHEPDLVACAGALEVPPAALVNAREALA